MTKREQEITCDVCGALAPDAELHQRWHDDLAAAIAKAGRTAGRVKLRAGRPSGNLVGHEPPV